MKKIFAGILIIFLAFPVFAKEITGFGIHASGGIDTSLSPVAGAGASYLLSRDESMSTELGFDFYYYGYARSMTETVSVLIYAVTVNMLFNYFPEKAGMYEAVGAGVGGTNLTSINTDYGDSGGGSLIINFGAGGTFGNGFELRAQLPIFISFAGFGTIFSPAITIGAGCRM
jgi:hypothetical protein